jgi:hypothetical protein
MENVWPVLPVWATPRRSVIVSLSSYYDASRVAAIDGVNLRRWRLSCSTVIDGISLNYGDQAQGVARRAG